MEQWGSRDVARIAIQISLTKDRNEEMEFKTKCQQLGIAAAAVDYGGEFTSSIPKIIERAVVAAKREGIIGDSHLEEGAVAGATHEALSQLMPKAIGLNVGGKLGIARYADHISVAIFFGIGLLNLNEVALGLGHRAI